MHSIRTKVMILASGIIISLIVILISGSFFVYKKSMLKAMDDSLIRSAQDSAWHLTNFVEGYLAPLEELSNEMGFQSMNWQVQSVIIGKQINPYYENVAVVDTVGMARYIDGEILDLSDRDYIKKALLGQKNISDVITSRKTGEKVMMAAVPIRRNEEIVGVLIARLNRELMRQYITARGFSEFGQALIVSELGDEIMSSFEEEAYQNLFEMAKEEAQYQNLSNFIQYNILKDHGIGEYRLQGVAYRVGFAKMQGTGWTVLISAPEDSLFGEIYRVTWFISGLTTVVGLTLLSITWYMVKRFTKPILELSSLMDRGASGDFGVYFETQARDEIAKLGKSFNHLMNSIKQLTYYDPLTSLRNRRVLIEDVKSMQIAEDKMILMMVQIDALQTITENYGIDMTEELYKLIAKRMQKVIIKQGQVYRAEADSFVVLFDDKKVKDRSEVIRFATRVREHLAKAIIIREIPVDVQFNFGALYLEKGKSCSDPLKAIAAACSYAKKIGGNQIQFFDDRLHQLVDYRNQLLNEMRKAIDEDELFLEFQPIFYIDGGHIGKLEALIRWNHPKRGRLYPNSFIEEAESSSLIVDMDYWVFEKVVKTLRLLMDRGRPMVMISINITSKTFESHNFLSRIKSILNEYDVDPCFIEIEITERMVIQHIEDSIEKLEAIRALNMKVAIDDFGIGYSSLSYIVKLPIDTIKIDKSFVDQMTVSRQAGAIVSTIINLCRNLELEVVAEGIETLQQLEYLQRLKCNMAQGYYLARPMPLESIEVKEVEGIVALT